jgi:hypothetical protein
MMKPLVYTIAGFMICAVLASGHGGGLDDMGCHNDRRRGGYHCHRGPLAGRSFASKAEAQRELEKQRQPKPPEKKEEKIR